MRFSLRTKLSFSYVLVALSLVAVLSFMSNFLLEKQFRSYIIHQRDIRSQDTVNLISQQYKGNTAGWDTAGIESIGISALSQGIIVKVKDVSDRMIWDATVHNNGMCSTMLAHMAHNMASRYPNFKGGYVEDNFPLSVGFQKIGSVDIGYYGPYYFTDNDLAFINTLNKMLITIGVFSLLLALILGTYMARRLSMPISRVITTAGQISKGNFDDRISGKSSTKEIGQLTETINDLAETLGKQERLRKRLTADVAHELRTPLATLQSHLEAMIDGIWKADTERLRSCHEEIIRMNRMVGDLEELARYESENLILQKTDFDLSQMIQHIINNFQTDFANKGVSIRFEGVEKMIHADKDKMSQVMVNLISNALKYTQESGSVEVSVTETETQIEVHVMDTGIGISGEDLPHIFERFYRADKSRNRLTGGSGIGLAIVKSIVEAHRGSIHVTSEAGRGSEFIVILPVQNYK